ncbi:MAG: hypothetical protein E2O56_03150 [Gammaproteobacteria bacterium]|nr:MAG: hypothetical protein E2O56_03150 [Gammaproteobacteria bacterium]
MAEPILEARRRHHIWTPDPKRSWITLQDVVAWVYLYPVRWLSRLIPVNALLWLADRAADPYARLRKTRMETVTRRMTDMFKGHTPPATPEIMAREFIRRDVRKGVDDLVMSRLDLEELGKRATITGMEHLDNALADGKGVIVISAHFHANRLAKYYLRRIGYPLMSIRNRMPGNTATGRFGKRFVVPAYGRFLNDIVEDETHTQDKGLGAKLLQRLRENGIVNVHIDAAISSEWFWVPFLNEERPFAGGFLRIAELTGTPLVPMQCLGNTSGFEIIFDPPIRYTGKSEPEEFTGRLMSMVGLLESWILAHPTHWELWARPMKRKKKP